MLFFRSGKWSYQTGEPLDPFLIADESCPVDVFIFTETELHVFFGSCKITIEFETSQHQHKADFLVFFQALIDGIDKFLVLIAGDLSGELNGEASFRGLT